MVNIGQQNQVFQIWLVLKAYSICGNLQKRFEDSEWWLAVHPNPLRNHAKKTWPQSRPITVTGFVSTI